MRAVLPALLLALFAAWSGTFVAGARLVPTLVGIVVLLTFVAASGGGRGLVGLGPRRWPIVVLFVAAVVASWAASEVSRAGRTAVLLLPAFLLLPSACARCWPDRGSRRIGAAALASVAVSVSVWGIARDLLGGDPRAASPLGHHLLLGELLVVLLPVVWWVTIATEPSRAIRRTLGWTGVVVVAAAVVASGSTACAAAVVVELFVLARTRSARRLVATVGVGGAVALAMLGDVERMLTSWRARLTYWEAGVRGWLERPALGHGPGSTGWTLAEHHAPVPGVNPPGELIGDLHSLPLAALYEVGLLGAGLGAVVAVMFVLRLRRRGRRGDGRSRLAVATLIGAATALTPGVTLGTPAIWIALLVVAGFAVAPVAEVSSATRFGATIYAIVALIGLGPSLAARWHYERALGAGSPAEVDRRLDRAVDADPTFPLYRLRTALYADGSAAAAEARRAAALAPGVAVSWLAAGERTAVVGQGEGETPAILLARACELAPLGGVAPLLLAARVDDPGAAATAGARALLGEPGLVASPTFDAPGHRRRVASRLERWPGVDAGWRTAIVESLLSAPRSTPPDDRLVVTFDDPDAAATESLSLVLFRRPLWPAAVASVVVRGEVFEAVELPAATGLRSTEPTALDRGCRGIASGLDGDLLEVRRVSDDGTLEAAEDEVAMPGSDGGEERWEISAAVAEKGVENSVHRWR